MFSFWNLFKIRSCKHHAEYDSKWENWYCTKCLKQLYEEDLPEEIWNLLINRFKGRKKTNNRFYRRKRRRYRTRKRF